MAQWLGAVDALAENLGSVSTTHIVAHKPFVAPLPGDLMLLSDL